MELLARLKLFESFLLLVAVVENFPFSLKGTKNKEE